MGPQRTAGPRVPACQLTCPASPHVDPMCAHDPHVQASFDRKHVGEAHAVVVHDDLYRQAPLNRSGIPPSQ